MTVNGDQNIEMIGEDVSLLKDGGILKQIIREGTTNESPYPGDIVDVHYTGTLVDGKKFDSSRDRNEIFSFKIGEGSVIKGWDQGVATMKKGEFAKFIVKPEYGYGENGSPPNIPPNATLIFEIELFDFQGEDVSDDVDKSVIKRTLKAGSGNLTPNDSARVVINVKGMDKNKRVFDERNKVEFEIGEGMRHHNIIEGIEMALTKFKQDERSILYIKSSRAWGSEGCKEFNIPEYTDVIYEVELVSFEKANESWKLNPQQKLEQCELFKNKGGELFKEGKYAIAEKKYNKIIQCLQKAQYDSPKDDKKKDKLLEAACLNMAACYLKLKEFKKAIESCEQALSIDSKNEKGMFRTAQAHFGLAEYEEAIKFFSKTLEINPNNKDATAQIALSKQKIKEYHNQEKNMYSRMFAK